MTTPDLPDVSNQVELIRLGLGDTIPISQILAHMVLTGIASNIDDPNNFSTTMDAYNGLATLTVPVLQGPDGDSGTDALSLHFRNDDYTEPNEMPTDLLDINSDLGKFWVFAVHDDEGIPIATTIYIWTGIKNGPLCKYAGLGQGFVQIPVGTPGPPGPYPVITPEIVIEQPGNGLGPLDTDSWVEASGTDEAPILTFHIAAPQGIDGPSAPFGSFVDVDFQSTTPQPGDGVIVSNRLTPGPPTGLGVTPVGSGGIFAPGTYYWAVTALVPNGETTVSNEATTTLVSSGSATLNWTAPTGNGSTGYNVYRGSTSNNKQLIGVITSGTKLSFTDIGLNTVASITPPAVGVAAGRPIWVNTSSPISGVKFYTVPQDAFLTGVVITTLNTPILCASYIVPQQGYDWVPLIFGHMQSKGANIPLTPLKLSAGAWIGGDTSTGTQVARGFPQYDGSIPISPYALSAITPNNSVARVPANATDAQSTVNIYMYNTGIAAIENFDSRDAELVIMVVPSGTLT
jgi:hypothetical protein